jgi:diacylglycerol kinase (ATP)
MQKAEALKILFVINPISGGKEKTDWEEQIRVYFKTSIHNIEMFLMTGTNDATSIVHHIDTVKPDRVVAVGGDGTVKLVAEILVDKNLPLAIVPAGSANGMAKELNIPADIEEALEIVVSGIEKNIDLICINDKELCIHLSDLGLNAMLVKAFSKSKKRGMWGYGQAIFKAMWYKQKMYVTVTTDNGTLKRKAFMVVLANARKYGTGGNINPDGNVADGLFEIVLLRKINLIEIMKALLTNKSFDPRRIEVIPTTKAEIKTIKRAHFQIDGEYKGKTTQVKAEILPGVLKMMLPQP